MNSTNTIQRLCLLCAAGILLLSPIQSAAQAILSKWQMNAGEFASYWENSTGNAMNPTFVFRTSTVLANVTRVCYDNNFVYVQSQGMTTNMGRFLNPGAPSAQNYTYKFPRNPTVPTAKTTSPLVGSIGMLVNGVPIYGLSNAGFYNGTNNNGMGTGTWNVEVYKAEGFVLDTTLGAHPQQQGAYHTHANPRRLYNTVASNVHSPLIGWAFDGNPVYGPYGYSTANNRNSAVTRMKTGYSLRNITTRTSLPNSTTTLTTAQYGPAVSATYPIGTYVEDYEWLASNGGDLDQYNGRTCVTPEFPNGVYAYFITISATGVPQFPYIIGPRYYGAPEASNLSRTPITLPTSGVTCFTTMQVSSVSAATNTAPVGVKAFPNPSEGAFTLSLPDVTGESDVEIYTTQGQLIFKTRINTTTVSINLGEQAAQGVFMLKVRNGGQEYMTKLVLR